jgi:hypothetical protein
MSEDATVRSAAHTAPTTTIRRTEVSDITPDPQALADAIAYLDSHDEPIVSTQRGHYARRAQQVLSDDGVIEFAANHRALNAPVPTDTGVMHGPWRPYFPGGTQEWVRLGWERIDAAHAGERGRVHLAHPRPVGQRVPGTTQTV